jgi:hypothetical protein
MTAGDFSRALWRKSSHSTCTGNCVELARTADLGAIRDSKNPSGPILVFPAAAFARFLAS